MKKLAKTAVTGAVVAALVGCAQNPPAESASQPASTLSDPAAAPPTSTATNPTAMTTTGAPAETSPGMTPSSGAATTGTATPSDAATKDPLTDEQIAAVTSLANNSEIEQAKLARARSKNEQVLQFAGMMIAHHGDAQRKQDSMSLGSAESTLSRDMLVEGSETMRVLKEKTGAEFDRAYMQAQVQGHQKVLDAIETKLIPNAKRDDLKAHLAELRPRVKQHLEQAEKTAATLAAARPTPPVASQ